LTAQQPSIFARTPWLARFAQRFLPGGQPCSTRPRARTSSA